jgi:hypothetical protein
LKGIKQVTEELFKKNLNSKTTEDRYKQEIIKLKSKNSKVKDGLDLGLNKMFCLFTVK